MRESSKTNQLRPAEFFATYFSGAVLDIGCGDDPVVPHAQPFDMQHGDANRILDYLVPESFDAVNSSHCLEHMHNPPAALQDWWALVRPGGYLIVIVPHEDLYEQGFWPSINNSDHKATFRISGERSWSPVSYNLAELAAQLPGGDIVDICVQDHGYHHAWRIGIGSRAQSRPSALKRFLGRMRHSIVKRLKRSGNPRTEQVADTLNRWLAQIGVPIDQTKTGALAQIQCIVRKKA